MDYTSLLGMSMSTLTLRVDVMIGTGLQIDCEHAISRKVNMRG